MKSSICKKSDNSKTKPSVKKKQSTPLRSILCLKNRASLKEIEKKEDCFILDFNPDESLRKTHVSNNNDAEISVVAEKGQVACRDFPHSRHNCAKYPFNKTSHESCCRFCYCFVCDTAAPCVMWTGSNGHCHVVDNEAGKLQRRAAKRLQILMQAVLKANGLSI
ncbi:hypothetical protein DCAR_0416351 [Daucus carota subsp. sativus]|uniref:Uncharacterized protein n=1 Tax=Daucus carota subsp. sativus TaxID=79200 RepID=A0A165XE41_DAUCS|nr:PREDICTED: uncharacterized protein LOC108217326 [Daucus carota subsp. sativus]WOG97012.1 hypothetical protein DCAR_0416351 [Daucus carota subsp. sativus]